MGMKQFQLLKAPKRLVIHRDGTFSLHLRASRGPGKRWQHWCDQISEKDFRRLNEADQVRLRALEERLCRQIVI
jgi:hypothetical protein